MNAKQLRELIIRPVLEHLNPEIPYSREAEDLLMMIAAHESHLGEYVKQVQGPALGPYQMEPKTLEDCWDNYLRYKNDIAKKVVRYHVHSDMIQDSGQDLIGNLWYATATARAQLYRFKEALPSKVEYVVQGEYVEPAYLMALAEYAKKYWNTEEGAAEVEDYYNAYIDLVQGEDV